MPADVTYRTGAVKEAGTAYLRLVVLVAAAGGFYSATTCPLISGAITFF